MAKVYGDDGYDTITNAPPNSTILVNVGGAIKRVTLAELIASVLAATAQLGSIITRSDLASLAALAAVDTINLPDKTTFLLDINDSGALWQLSNTPASKDDDVTPTADASKHWRRILGL